MRYYHGTTDVFVIDDGILKPPIDTGMMGE